MPEVHGKGLGGTNIRDTYQQEIEAAQKQSEAATKVAQQMVAEKVTRESKAKSDIYGEVLGNMYDGDRDAIMQFRDHIRQEFLDGTYSSDPSMYQTRIANLNAMIENAENFYKTTYGDDSADGKGNTYRDIQIRHERGNSVEFWEVQGLEMKGDEWMEAQQRLQQLQGGMYRDLQFTPDGNVMARAINPETGEMGDLMGFENLPQREIGSQNFLPDTQVLTPATMMDLAGTADVQVRLKQLYAGLLEDSGEVMYNGKLTNVNDMDALQKMNYMSDLYFQDMVGRMTPDGTWKPAPNNSEARKFRRSLAKEMGLSGDEARAFIEGDVQSMMETNQGQANFNEAQRHWREVTRQSFVKPTTTTTGRGAKQPEPPDYIKNRYVVNLQDLSEEDRAFAGLMGPFDLEQINGDGLEKPIEIKASRAFEMEGVPTEKANYEIYGAAFHEGNFIARVQIPKVVVTTDPLSGSTEEKVEYVTRDVVVSPTSIGWRKEIYNNLLNNSSDLSMAMAGRYSNWASEAATEAGVPRPQ